MGEKIESKELRQLAIEAAADASVMKNVVGKLKSGSRRERQKAAQVLAFASEADAAVFLPHASVLVGALEVPEAQTRWEILAVLARLADIDASFCDDAISGAEMALFDEGSGPVRLAAMRFLCKAGSLSADRSEKVWPLIDEAIQCYHGDHEFFEMLSAVIGFSAGEISEDVKDQLAARMKFDAENAKGTLKRKAIQILENASK